MCGAELETTERAVCTTCLATAPIITTPSPNDGEMCRLFWHLLPVERAAAMFRYSVVSPWKALVTAGKFGHRHDVLIDMGHLLGTHFVPLGFFEGIDALLPMPTTHEKKRGYNQSELIARGVSAVTHLPVLTDVVKRIDKGKAQTHRSARERRTALRGAFVLTNPEAIAHRHIAMVDDVCTTGASLVALGEALRQAADVRLSVLTLMRATSL